MQRFRKSNSGTILVLVLVYVVMLSFVVVAFLQDATARIKYYGLFHNHDDLRTDAYSALEATLAVINLYREVEGALYGPEQGWGSPLERLDWQPAHAKSVSIRFTDESSRFSLNDASFERLRTTFTLLDFDLSTAERLADSLLDWIDSDSLSRLNGADGDDYTDKDPPYRAANGPLTHWDELPLIEHFKEAFWDEDGTPMPELARFKSAFSLNYSGPININAAPAFVLSILAEEGVLDAFALDAYKRGFDGESGTDDDRLLRPETLAQVILSNDGNAVSASIEQLGIEIEARRGEARFLLSTMVKWQGADHSANDRAPAEPQTTTGSNAIAANPNNDNAPAQNRQQARGSARTQAAVNAQLGYPFEFVHLVENQRF